MMAVETRRGQSGKQMGVVKELLARCCICLYRYSKDFIDEKTRVFEASVSANKLGRQ